MRTRHLLLVPVAAAVLALSACDGDLELPGASSPPGDSAAPTEPPTATEPPPDTAAPSTTPDTEPPTGTTPTTEPTDDDSGFGALPIVLVVGAIIIAGAVLASVVRRTRHQVAPPPTAPQPRTPDSRHDIAATARWFHDQLSLEILALPVADAQRRWSSQRSRLDQLAIDLRRTAAQFDPEIWSGVAAAVDGLVAALDTALRVKASPTADVSSIDEATATASRNRADLLSWLVAAERSIV